MRVECTRLSFLPSCFYLDSLSSPQKNSLERSPSQGRQAAFRPPAWNRLRSSCMVIRVDDLDIHQVRSPGHREAWLERGRAVHLAGSRCEQDHGIQGLLPSLLSGLIHWSVSEHGCWDQDLGFPQFPLNTPLQTFPWEKWTCRWC